MEFTIKNITYFLFVSCTLNILYISEIYNKHIQVCLCVHTHVFFLES